jgi:excinuclease ABC subunit C
MIDENYISSLPESSGVYIFRDADNRIVYIGKARSLRDRVRSYFREGTKDVKTERLAGTIEHVEVVLTQNEKEAFLLESNLIKEHAPKYNINLKDDKTYISLKLTTRDRYPALFVTREIKDDGSLYFGPYPHAKDVRDVVKLVQGLYPIRRCKDTVFKKRKRACILFQLGKCLAPCAEPVDEVEYRAMVEELVDFLSGRDEKLLKDLERRIADAATHWRFEEASHLKERYLAIKGMVEKQHVHEHHGKNRDVWAFLEGTGGIKISLLSFRRGVLISKKLFKQPLVAASAGEGESSFLFQYYSERPVPDEIVVSEEIDDIPFLEQHLRNRKGGMVRIYGPHHRAAREMIQLAVENLHEPEPMALGEAFRKALRLKKEPGRIEIYDISHIHGKNPSGAMVVFENFKASKNDYRVFHIRGADTMDDLASLSEVLRRRLKDEKLGPLPDLFIIDGGKGHLSAALKVLREMNIDRDAISIAKAPGRKRMEDVVYLPLRKNPLLLPKATPVFKEIVKMRDEAHRFAITSHRRWKRKEDLGRS